MRWSIALVVLLELSLTCAAEPNPQCKDRGWANLCGRVVLEGPMPETRYVTITKDNEICPAKLRDDSLLVDHKTRGIQNVLIAAESVTRIAAPLNEAREVTILAEDCQYHPRVAIVRVGESLVLKSRDPLGHGFNFAPPGETPISPLIPTAERRVFKPKHSQNQPIEMTCNVHPWMRAYFLPLDHPYAAITDAEGNFEISNLPADENFALWIWHERSGRIHMPPGSNNRTFSLRLSRGETRELETIPLPVTLFP